VRFERVAVTPGAGSGVAASHPADEAERQPGATLPGRQCGAGRPLPDRLRALVEEAILRHLDPDRVARLRRIEEAERWTFIDWLAQWPPETRAAKPVAPEPAVALEKPVAAEAGADREEKPVAAGPGGAAPEGEDDRHCQVCGRPLRRPERGPLPRYCSGTCRSRAFRRRP